MPFFHGTVDSIYVLGEVRLYLFLLFFYMDNTDLIFILHQKKGHHHEPPFPIPENLQFPSLWAFVVFQVAPGYSHTRVICVTVFPSPAFPQSI